MQRCTVGCEAIRFSKADFSRLIRAYSYSHLDSLGPQNRSKLSLDTYGDFPQIPFKVKKTDKLSGRGALSQAIELSL